MSLRPTSALLLCAVLFSLGCVESAPTVTDPGLNDAGAPGDSGMDATVTIDGGSSTDASTSTDAQTSDMGEEDAGQPDAGPIRYVLNHGGDGQVVEIGALDGTLDSLTCPGDTFAARINVVSSVGQDGIYPKAYTTRLRLTCASFTLEEGTLTASNPSPVGIVETRETENGPDVTINCTPRPMTGFDVRSLTGNFLMREIAAECGSVRAGSGGTSTFDRGVTDFVVDGNCETVADEIRKNEGTDTFCASHELHCPNGHAVTGIEVKPDFNVFTGFRVYCTPIVLRGSTN